MPEYHASWFRWITSRRAIQIGGGTERLVVDGADLVAAEMASLSMLCCHEASNCDLRESSKRMSVKAGREQLWRALAEGRVAAVGKKSGGGIIAIPAHEWSYIELETDTTGSDQIAFTDGMVVTSYADVVLPRDVVTACWHPALLPGAKKECPSNCATALPPRDGKLQAARQALVNLYPDGVPVGSSEKQRQRDVNKWLHKNGAQSVSLSTIRRALNPQ
jgi:hypothetical protein